jgi:hypothetical protein
MSNSITISKANPLLPTEDFWKLRDAGIDLISKLGSDLWTDYNTHDPGISILEAVSYAITDLGYRTGFDMKDLLAPSRQSNKAWAHIFYTARQILHCNPLTISDYRKIIIDVKGVRNAWIEPSKDYEVPLLVDYQFISDSSSDCGCGGNNDDKICAGKLTIDEKTLTTKVGQLSLQIKQTQQQFNKIKGKGDTAMETFLTNKINAINDKIKQIELLPEGQKTSSKILEINGLYNVMIEYEEDVLLENNREEVRQNVASRLHRHRNLCEDFLSINAVDYDDFNILVSFVLEENADPDKVLAQIFFTIYQYFVPTVNFYTIEQMMVEKHLQVDEIFEGPALKHGFIDTQELEATDFFRDMRLSDIINAVMDIEGIKAITYLHIPSDELKKELAKDPNVFFNNWINSLKENRNVARLDVDNSTILFCKEREFITYNAKKTTDRRIDRAKKLFNDLKAQERQRKLSGHEIDLPVPAGENMELEDYFPVTYSLPSPYHVKEYDTVEDEKDPNRKTQQLQLKGYLLFFEQILGDYLSQLGHLREIFSFDENVHQTYYTRVLTEINDLKLLILDHTPPAPASTYKNTLNLIFKDKFPNDKVLSTFASTIQNLVEGPTLFAERRNDFLDHLLARFSEDMSEYERITRLLLPDNQEDSKLIGDKIRTLQDYIKISNYRAKALNYAPPMKEQAGEDQVDESFVWNSENVSGVERRVGRLLGFQDISRRNLTPDSLVNQSNNGMSKILLVNPTCPEEIWLESNEVKAGCCTETLLSELILVAGNRKNYEAHDQTNPRSRNKEQANIGAFHYVLLDSEGSPIAHTPDFRTRQAREEVLKGILHEIACINDNEGMHLVEHILLRPKLDSVLDERDKPQTVKLLDICLDPCDLGKGIDQNVEKHRFRFKITRTPAERCYDKMPWVLELMMDILGENQRNILFNPLNLKLENQEKSPQKFKFYDSMNQRLRDLREFSSEPDNYVLLNDLTGFELLNSDTKKPIGLIQFFTENEVKALIEGDDNARTALILKWVFQKANVTNLTKEEDVLLKQLLKNQKDKILKPILSLIRDALIKYLSFQLDLYCEEDPCDHNEDPYSFRTTIVLPCWVKRFRDKTFRNLVEKTIQNETPAHIQPNIRWVGILEMRDFEEKYYTWLLESMSTYAPDYEKVNPLVEKLNHLVECGHCEDDCKGTQVREIPTKGNPVPVPTDGKP